MKIKVSDVRQAAKKHLALSSPNVRRVGSGESNTNFLVEGKFLFRINANSKDKTKISREWRILRYLDEFDLAPHAILKDTSRGIVPQDFLVVDFSPGKDLRGFRLSREMIKDLAKLTAELHSIPTKKGMPVYRTTYGSVVRNIKKMIRHTKQFGGKEDSKFLLQCIHNLRTKGPKNKATVAHGDICEQNLIYTPHKVLKFIDFEGCGIYDPAYDIADTFTGFGKNFSKEHQRLFYEEYFKLRKDSTLRKRVDVFIPLKMFETFCWSIMHVYEIKAGIVSKDIQEKEPIQHHIDYATSCLNKCKKLDLISSNKVKLFGGVN